MALTLEQLNEKMNQCVINYRRLESRINELETSLRQIQAQLMSDPSNARLKVQLTNTNQQIRSLKQELHNLEIGRAHV